MKRTVKQITAAPDEKIWWKKLGGGSFRLDKGSGKYKIIKPGETFQASVNQIPEAFRDVCVPVDGTPIVPIKKVEGIAPSFKKVPNEEDEELFDVVNQKGKKLAKGFTEEKADAFIKDLEA